MDKLHVLHVTGAMVHGGAEVMLMDILRNLPNDVHFDFLIQTGGAGKRVQGDFDQEIFSRGCRIFYICPQWTGGGLRYLSEFKKLIQNEIGMPDVVHSHINHKGGMAALAAKRCGIRKIIVHTHGIRARYFWEMSPRGVEMTIQRFLINRCATDFWCCSRQEAGKLFSRGILKHNQYRVINNAVNLDAFFSVDERNVRRLREELNLPKDCLVLGNVGRITKEKNLLFAVEIIRILKERIGKIIFIFLGPILDDNYFQQIQQKIKEYCLEDNIFYLGDRNDVPAVLKTFNLFLAPSKREGFGMVVTEAQAAGLPCLVSCGHPHTVDMGLHLVKFMENYDSSKWADEVLNRRGTICTDRNIIRAAFVKNNFDAKENTKNIIQMYKS